MPPELNILFHNNFIPAEWIAAHGFNPVKLLVHSCDNPSIPYLQGLCPYVWLVANQVATSNLPLISTTTCDQMRRFPDLIDKNIFLFNMPVTWQSKSSYKLYCNELRRLSDYLVTLGGTKPTDEILGRMIKLYAEKRQQYSFPKIPSDNNISVAILGGPMIKEHFKLYDLIAEKGGSIAFDSSELSDSLLALTLENKTDAADLFESMAKDYFYNVPAPFRRPDSILFDFLTKMIAEKKLKGLIFARYLWCDHWNALIERVKSEFGLPVVDIEFDDVNGVDTGRNLTRIEAFMETLAS